MQASRCCKGEEANIRQRKAGTWVSRLYGGPLEAVVYRNRLRSMVRRPAADTDGAIFGGKRGSPMQAECEDHLCSETPGMTCHW